MCACLILCALFTVPAAAIEEEAPALQDLYPALSAVTDEEEEYKDTYWGEFYFQGDYSEFDDDNLIGDGTLKLGFNWFQIGGRDVQPYIKGRFLIDRNADFWNNMAQIGAGARYRPFSQYGLILFSEVLNGYYTGREGEDENNDSTPYWDFQGGYAFWQYWGDAAWQIEGVNAYLPFTGWREVYSDGIYYHRDDDNYISTLDYKEGLLLGRVGGVSFDAFIDVNAGFDRNGDSWNNYIRCGPGVSITPFENLDLKLSCKYNVGYYFRGDFDNGKDKTFDDFEVTLTFWAGW